MGHRPRARTAGFRRAVAGSVAIHLVIVGVAFLTLGGGEPTRPAPPPGLDTRSDDVVVRMTAVELSAPATEPDPPAPAPMPEVAQPAPTPDPSPAPESTGGSQPPLRCAVPNALPSEMLALIRRPSAAIADSNVKPSAATSAAARPIHGAMKAGETVVYVLDCSGSMGEFGKFAAARDSLVATLRGQPKEVRFQVVAYNTTARALVPGTTVPATAANVAAAEARLAGLSASGRSNHAEALRAALALRPKAIVVLTDAEFAPGATSCPVFLARVTADGVGPPRELR